ncbi:MAG: ABC transporter permease, partial [Bacteroidota bacterium]
MIKTQLLIAFRQLLKNRTSALINIVGLALGLAAFVLILGYVAFEWSYNQMYDKGDSVFRMVAAETGTEDYYTGLPPGYGPFITSQFPFVENAARVILGVGDGVLGVQDEFGEKFFREINTAYIDPSFFSMMSIAATQGDLNLSGPNTSVISTSIAEKYYGSTDVVGKRFSLSNQFSTQDYLVKGVIPDPPMNSDIPTNIYLSLETLATDEGRDGNGWADPNGLDNGFAEILVELSDPSMATTFHKKVNEWVSENRSGENVTITLQAVKDIHMGTSLNDPLPTFGNRKLATFLFIVAMLILAIAWFNYINLSTAQSLQRAKEVGIRKVVGATRNQLVLHYLLETLVLTVLAFIIAVLIIPLIQPAFNLLIDGQTDYGVFFGSKFFWIGIITVFAGTLFAGAYVAFGLSAYMPTEILQGRFISSAKGVWVRKGLVVSQFVISIALITCTLILSQQLRLLNRRDMGLATDQRVAIAGPDVTSEKFVQQRQWFRDQLEALAFVKKYSASGNLPGKGYNFSAVGFAREDGQEEDKDKSYSMFFIDENFVDTYEINLLDGRTFTTQEVIKNWGAEKMLLNESALKQMGFSEPSLALGELVNWGEFGRWEIIGVVQDYHHYSLKYQIRPMIFLPGRNSGYFTLEMGMDNFSENMSQLEELYTEAFPGNPFQYEFLDETFAKQYESEQRLGKLFTNASLLAIFISALGLFGLVSFIARQRTKEIGIRKILGASVQNIVTLFSQDFLKLVAIAIVIASPIAWYIASNWLENFAY